MATHCRECGRPLENVAGKVEKDFCPRELRPCRNKFTTRRRERGAQLYDLVMQDRFSRDRPPTLTADQVEDLLRGWHREDLEERDGRVSWNVPPRPDEEA